MRTATRLGWIMVGVLIGVLATSVMGTVRAQQTGAPGRFVLTETSEMKNSLVYSLFFVRDTKSNACWIAAGGGGALTALAPAPATACQ
jgi:hypothetical protein